jgi:hypothetical protein
VVSQENLWAHHACHAVNEVDVDDEKKIIIIKSGAGGRRVRGYARGWTKSRTVAS